MSFPSWPLAALCLLLMLGGLAAAPADATSSPAPDSAADAPKEEASPTPQPPKAVSPTDAVESSVVKVFSTVRYPAVYKPWMKQGPSDVTGSGVVIAGNRILTNAHVVMYASGVQIQANQGGDSLSATVEFLALGIDLAVLKLDDESFFASHRALPFAKDLPAVQDAVMVYGYPKGGTSLSVTKGIVSRVDFDGYYAGVTGLRIQIDAAINSGNSGGPAVVANKMVGLAFSRLDDSENIGYIVPTEEIELFLRDVADGHYDGKWAMYEPLQTMDNPALHPFLKIDASKQGIIVRKPESDAPDYPLKEWDVISRIGDTPVDNQGMVRLKNNLRVRFQYLIQKNVKDGKVPMTIVRKGKDVRIELPLAKTRARVIPDLQGLHPSYFVFGPLAFSEATTMLVNDYADGKNAADWMLDLSYNGSPLLARAGGRPRFPGERLVFVSAPFFPHKLAKGYSNPSQQVVKTINGIEIKNLAHLVEVLRDLRDEFVVISFDMNSGGETEVFPRAEMLAATEEILTDNGVRSQGSADMMAVWNAKPATP
jgi:S1-C subfamily serine protease